MGAEAERRADYAGQHEERAGGRGQRAAGCRRGREHRRHRRQQPGGQPGKDERHRRGDFRKPGNRLHRGRQRRQGSRRGDLGRPGGAGGEEQQLCGPGGILEHGRPDHQQIRRRGAGGLSGPERPEHAGDQNQPGGRKEGRGADRGIQRQL